MTAILSALALTASLVVAAAPPAVASRGEEYVATIRVDGGDGSQFFRIHLVEDADIAAAFDNMRGESNAHPNGLIVQTYPEYNAGYSWYIDPYNVDFVDISMELCDGLPSDVEKGELTSDRYCPWNARVAQMTFIP